MTLAILRRRLKTRLPLLSYVAAGGRYLRDINRTVDLVARIADTAGAAPPEYSAGTVVINSVRTYIPVQLATEAALALKLRQRGYRAVMLYDDGLLKHHDTLSMTDYSPWQTYYNVRRRVSIKLLQQVPSIAGMLLPYSQLLPDVDISRAREQLERNGGRFAKIDTRPFVQDSLVRFFVSVADDALLSRDPDYQRAKEMFTDNCLLSLNVAREVVSRLQPDIVLSTHGIYTTWGPFVKYAQTQGIRTITVGCNGFRNNALDLSCGGIAASKSDGGYFSHLVSGIDAGEMQKDAVLRSADEYMQTRFGGSASDVARVIERRSEDADHLLDQLGEWRCEGRRIFAMFPNVMWDNATTFHENNRVFDSPVDWVVQTVRRFLDKPEDILLIRVHPAEHSFMHVRRSIRDILEHYFGPEVFANPNIIFIPASARLPSYRLFDYIEAGLVYNGTIALELIHYGKPVVIGARAAYSDKGFTYDITGREQYFQAFDRIEEIRRIQNQGSELARYFIYQYFFLQGVPVELMSSDRFLFPNVKGDPRRIWNDRNLDHIVSVMVGEEKYFQDYWRKKGDQA